VAAAEVITTRLTPARVAARSTRSVPSRAGTIRALGSPGVIPPSGEATWSTWSQPAMAASQPSSRVRSATKTVRRSPDWPAAATAARTAGSFDRSRTVARTS
jgi:hypothetical protein